MINLKVVSWFGIAGVSVLVLVILFTPATDTKTEATSTGNPLSPIPQRILQDSDAERYNELTSPRPLARATYSGSISTPPRTLGANQVIRRTAQNSDSSGQISMGTGVGARLANAIISGNTASPAIALIEDNALGIPAGSKAIGGATFDEERHRISIHFSTTVYPDGEQHSIQAIAMMPDGSAGLDGDYSSGNGKRQLGRFLGYFISGLTDGMKERKQGSLLGGQVEPGSVRNGVLNGITKSGEDQAKQYSDSMGEAHASMTLPPNMEFILYFEHEYRP